MSTNKPSIGSVVLEILPWILRKYSQISILFASWKSFWNQIEPRMIWYNWRLLLSKVLFYLYELKGNSWVLHYASSSPNPIHTNDDCRQQTKLTFFVQKCQNSNFHYHICIQHEKCIQMSTNKPSIGTVVLKVSSWILR